MLSDECHLASRESDFLWSYGVAPYRFRLYDSISGAKQSQFYQDLFDWAGLAVLAFEDLFFRSLQEIDAHLEGLLMGFTTENNWSDFDR